MTLAWMLLAAPAWIDAPAEGGVKLAPKYTAGQEIVYSGMIIESCTGAHGVTYEQPYDVETTALVTQMDAKRNAEVACYTVVNLPSQDPDAVQKAMEDVSTSH